MQIFLLGPRYLWKLLLACIKLRSKKHSNLQIFKQFHYRYGVWELELAYFNLNIYFMFCLWICCFRTDFSALDSQQESSYLGEAKSRSPSSQQLPLALCLQVGSWEMPSHAMWDSGLHNKNILNRFYLSVCMCVCVFACMNAYAPMHIHMYICSEYNKEKETINLRDLVWEEFEGG